MTNGPTEPILGVARSALGRKWLPRLQDERLGLALAQRLEAPELVGRVLAARGATLDDAPRLLNPKLRDWMPDPSTITDVDKAVARLQAAIKAGEQIAVFGDYDVDGATSTALLTRYFKALGQQLLTHIPDRQKEGYGPNIEAMESLKAKGAKIVITVDCGTLAYEPLAHAAGLGLEVIVLDHHLAEPNLPKCHALVNPNRIDDTSGLGDLAAVGVVFMTLVALNRALRDSKWFADQGLDEPNLMNLLDIVALGTVADVVPLRGLNRAFVTQGLEVMARRGNAGINALLDVASITDQPRAYHCGFVLGPRVNAGGRVGEAPLGARLLNLDDPIEANEIATKLDLYNKERQAIEAQVLDEAMAQMLDRYGDKPDVPLVMVHGENWHPGVIGIVASRLKERAERPALVLAGGTGNEPIKGSGRSITGVDLGRAITAALEAGLLVNGGGHAMAAGVTLDPKMYEKFEAFVSNRLAAPVAVVAAEPALLIDSVLGLRGVTVDLVALMERAGPFGSANPTPKVAIADAKVIEARAVGADKSHVRLVLADKGSGGRLTGIAFRAAETPLGAFLLERSGSHNPIHLVGTLKRDTYMGREKVDLTVEDAAEA